jgi:hypothetical protein
MFIFSGRPGGSSRVGAVQCDDVAFGSKADLTAPKSNFRFAPESGLKSDIMACPLGAMNGLMHRSN